jgi:aminodeoxyfutalosine synthase
LALKRLINSSSLKDIHEKVEAGTRINDNDALRLFQSNDLYALGSMANRVREKKNGNSTFYNINRHIDYTNVCATTCKFCAFSRFEGEKGAFELTHEQIVQKAKEAFEKEHITELHLVGGLHPKYGFEWYEELLRLLKKTLPAVHLKGFTAVEIVYFADKFNLGFNEVLSRLKAAGLDSLPGGGAEIFHPEVRRVICPAKATADQWLEAHRTAHQLGLKSNATMLYGHIENVEHRVDHLRRLRELQDETSGFQAFIPLAFHPDHTIMDQYARPSGLDDLRTLAVSRIYLDNFDHIKAYWVALGAKLAQLSLSYGVDDIDGTVMGEKIYHMAGSDTPEAMTVDELRKLIQDAGRDPVERDTLYREIK